MFKDNVLLLGTADSQPSDFSVTKCILAAEDGVTDQQSGQLLEKNVNNNNVVAILVKPDVVTTTPSGKNTHNCTTIQ